MILRTVRTVAILLVLSGAGTGAAAAESVEAQIQQLMEQNRRLQAQVDEQRRQIDQLSARLSEIAPASAEPTAGRPTSTGELRISGEAGMGFFDTGPDGTNPNAEFRVDDAKVFIEARVWNNSYFFGGLELSTREANDEFFHVGELYLDFEGVTPLLGHDHALNLRAGRFYVPFGEEYQVRGVMDNPLISHSVADVWGIDEGVEAYGDLGAFQYAVGIQNGGIKTMHDFDKDKSIAGRISYSPASWLRMSGSAMRTGNLNTTGDALSAIWFGGGFFRALYPAGVTPVFNARLYELDAVAHWAGGSLRLAGGNALFDDNTGARDSRRMRYYSFEAVQDLIDRFFGAVRYSRVQAPRGYALAGQAALGPYFFGNSATDDLHRLSVGFGYRFATPIVWKAEYNVEKGRMTNGAARDDESMISSELGVRF